MRRKLTTIVAADIVGYSRLLRDDEQATLSAIENLRTNLIGPKVGLYSGRIFRFLGDGTLLEFNSVLGAVEFAIDLQHSLNDFTPANARQYPILLRIGVSLGDVIIENDDIHGDGVNIAVRLEALAEPGGICLADPVYSVVKHKLASNFVSIGPRSLKNIKDPIHVWRWRSPPGVCSHLPAESPDEVRPSNDGEYMLAPKLIDLILRLHARSALLAVSNALDAVIHENEDRANVEQLYYHISEQLHLARSLLNDIQIERDEDDNPDGLAPGPRRQSMGEFVAGVFNDSKIGYVFRIIPEAQAILTSHESMVVKRKQFMALVRRFHNEDYILQCRRLIKSASIG